MTTVRRRLRTSLGCGRSGSTNGRRGAYVTCAGWVGGWEREWAAVAVEATAACAEAHAGLTFSVCVRHLVFGGQRWSSRLRLTGGAGWGWYYVLCVQLRACAGGRARAQPRIRGDCVVVRFPCVRAWRPRRRVGLAVSRLGRFGSVRFVRRSVGGWSCVSSTTPLRVTWVATEGTRRRRAARGGRASGRRLPGLIQHCSIVARVTAASCTASWLPRCA